MDYNIKDSFKVIQYSNTGIQLISMIVKEKGDTRPVLTHNIQLNSFELQIVSIN